MATASSGDLAAFVAACRDTAADDAPAWSDLAQRWSAYARAVTACRCATPDLREVLGRAARAFDQQVAHACEDHRNALLVRVAAARAATSGSRCNLLDHSCVLDPHTPHPPHHEERPEP